MKMLQMIFAAVIILPIILGIIFTQGSQIEQQAATANFTNTQTQTVAESTGWIVPTVLLAVVILGVIGMMRTGDNGSVGGYLPLYFVYAGAVELAKRTWEKFKKQKIIDD